LETVLKQDRAVPFEETRYFAEVRCVKQILFISKFISIFWQEIAEIRLENLTFPSWPAEKSNYEDVIDREKNLEDELLTKVQHKPTIRLFAPSKHQPPPQLQ
jgi:hypothetical protein